MAAAWCKLLSEWWSDAMVTLKATDTTQVQPPKVFLFSIIKLVVSPFLTADVLLQLYFGDLHFTLWIFCWVKSWLKFLSQADILEGLPI